MEKANKTTERMLRTLKLARRYKSERVMTDKAALRAAADVIAAELAERRDLDWKGEQLIAFQLIQAVYDELDETGASL